MRRSFLTGVLCALGAFWIVKACLSGRTPTVEPHPPPRAAIPFRAGSAREWLHEDPTQLHHAVLRRENGR